MGETRPRLLRSVSDDAHLYHCEIREKSHKWTVNEIKYFEQDDLDDDDIMILDIQQEVYVWIGKNASDEERRRGPKFAEVNY